MFVVGLLRNTHWILSSCLLPKSGQQWQSRGATRNDENQEGEGDGRRGDTPVRPIFWHKSGSASASCRGRRAVFNCFHTYKGEDWNELWLPWPTLTSRLMCFLLIFRERATGAITWIFHQLQLLREVKAGLYAGRPEWRRSTQHLWMASAPEWKHMHSQLCCIHALQAQMRAQSARGGCLGGFWADRAHKPDRWTTKSLFSQV